jgi:two-component system, LytTR family, sensor kinase
VPLAGQQRGSPADIAAGQNPACIKQGVPYRQAQFVSVRGAKRSLWLPEWLQSSLENPLLGVDPQRPFLGHPIYWLCQLGGWGSLFMLMGIAFLNEPLRRAHVVPMVNQCVFCASGLIFTHIFRALYHLRNWKDLRGATFVPKVVLGCLTFAVVETIVTHAAIFNLMGSPSDGNHLFSGFLIMGLIQNAVTLVAWTSLYLGYQYQRELQEERINRVLLDAELKEAQLQRLRSQINPHFLFNSLNTIRAIAGVDAELTREAVTQLAELMRAALESSEEKVVTFDEELRIVQAYLGLEQLRHRDRLRIEVSINEELLSAVVPPLICQTLVENALKHGAHSSNQTGTVRYALTGDQKSVRFEVRNPGSLKVAARNNGTGLVNAQRRLQLIYGKKAALSLRMTEPGEVTALLVLPRIVGVS